VPSTAGAHFASLCRDVLRTRDFVKDIFLHVLPCVGIFLFVNVSSTGCCRCWGLLTFSANLEGFRVFGVGCHSGIGSAVGLREEPYAARGG